MQPTTRRAFLESSLKTAATAASLLHVSKLAAEIPGLTYGVQLFMMRDVAVKDLTAALKSIRNAGYAQVEYYPIAYKHSAAELKRMTEDAGLTATSGHFDFISLDDRLDFAHQLGLKYMVCPWIPQEHWGSEEGFHKAAARFNHIGSEARKRGIQFVFHNHCYEFRPLASTTGWQILMENTDPRLVNLELDIYWLAQGGQNPLAMLKKYSDRTRLLHLKGRATGASTGYDVNDAAIRACTELADGGAIDWRAILHQAHAQGIRYAYVDQDRVTLPLDESLRLNRAYLSRLT